MKKLLLIAALLFFFSYSSHAQSFPGFSGGGGSSDKIYDGKIVGVIIDSISQKAVEMANIAIYNSGKEKPLDGAVTNEKGDFKFKNLKNGKYKVIISFLGYESSVVDSIEISDKRLTADIGKVFIRPRSKLLKEAV